MKSPTDSNAEEYHGAKNGTSGVLEKKAGTKTPAEGRPEPS